MHCKTTTSLLASRSCGVAKDSISNIENGVENINTNDLPANAEQENIIKRIFNHIMKFLHIKIR